MKLQRLLLLLLTLSTFLMAEDYLHYRLGVKYKEAGSYDLAVEELRRVITMYPDHYNAYLQLGEIEEIKGNNALAEAHYKKALQYNPGWRKAYKKLASIYEKDGKLDKAVEMLQMAQRGADAGEKEKISDKIDELVGRKRAVTTGGTKNSSSKGSGSKKNGSKQSSVKSVKPLKISESAKEALKEAIRVYRSGKQSGSTQKMNEALNHIRKALNLAPGYPAAYYYGGVIRREMGQNEMARVNFEKGLSDPEMGFNGHFYLGKIYGEKGEYALAIEHLKKYRDATDYDPGRREALGMIEVYEKHLAAENKENQVDLKEVGRTNIEKEMSTLVDEVNLSEIEVRIAPLLKMVIVDTVTDQGQDMLKGVHLFRDTLYDKSIAEFRSLMEKYPTGNVAANSLFNIGVCQMKLHDWSGASRTFRQYASRFPSQQQAGTATFLEAVAYREMKQNAEAEKLFFRYIKQKYDKEWIGKSYEKLGDIYAEREEHGKAVTHYDLADKNAKSNEDRVFASYKQGLSLEKLGNWSRAKGEFEKVIRIGTENSIFERVPDSYYHIADYEYHAQNYNKAEEAYKKVTRLYKNYKDTPWGLFQLGNIKKNRGELNEAIKAYDSLIATYPDDYWSKQAQWKRKDAIWQYQYGSSERE